MICCLLSDINCKLYWINGCILLHYCIVVMMFIGVVCGFLHVNHGIDAEI